MKHCKYCFVSTFMIEGYNHILGLWSYHSTYLILIRWHVKLRDLVIGASKPLLGPEPPHLHLCLANRGRAICPARLSRLASKRWRNRRLYKGQSKEGECTTSTILVLFISYNYWYYVYICYLIIVPYICRLKGRSMTSVSQRWHVRWWSALTATIAMGPS
jgi:hypothetical protein